jgi:DNA polymerase-1
VPRDGFVFVAADYSQVELHCLAQSCKDLLASESRLLELLNDGTDVHVLLASMLLGQEYEQAVAAIAAGDEETIGARQTAKAANYGYPGGCSARTFAGIAQAQDLPVDARTAARIRAVWFHMLPEMTEFFEFVKSCKTGDGWYFARLPRTGFVRSGCTFTAACNTYFQGLAAAGAKRALWHVARAQRFEPESPLFGTYLVNFVHDELLLEAPESRAHEAALELQRLMEKHMNALIPDCPTRAEPVVMRWWSKKAKTIVRDGRLIPWPEEVA